MAKSQPKPFTGYHMFAILVAFFGVVIAVNVTMARLASRSFGGEVVDNSYVASQKFNGWLDEAKREKALGWKAEATRETDGKVSLVIDGAPDGPAAVNAIARHPLGVMPEQQLTFAKAGHDRFVSQQAIPAGRWRLRIEAQIGGQQFRAEEDLK